MSRGHGTIQRALLDTLSGLPRQSVTLAELTHRVHGLKWPPRNGRNAYTRSQREAVRRALARLADEGHVERDGDGVKLMRRSSATRQRQTNGFKQEEEVVLAALTAGDFDRGSKAQRRIVHVKGLHFTGSFRHEEIVRTSGLPERRVQATLRRLERRDLVRARRHAGLPTHWGLKQGACAYCYGPPHGETVYFDDERRWYCPDCEASHADDLSEFGRSLQEADAYLRWLEPDDPGDPPELEDGPPELEEGRRDRPRAVRADSPEGRERNAEFLRLLDGRHSTLREIAEETGWSVRTVTRGAEQERALQEAEGEKLALEHSEWYCAICSRYFKAPERLQKHLAKVHHRGKA